MDSGQWTKLLRTSNLYSHLFSSSESDIIYGKAKGRQRVRIDYQGFCEALELLCTKLQLNLDDLKGLLVAQKHQTSRPSSARGPSRFFYDHSTYTGTHSKGGPAVVDKVESGQIYGKLDLSQLCDRSACDRRGRKVTAASNPGFSTHQDRKRALTKPTTPLNDSLLESSQNVKSILERDMKGPERFYYDKQTYTGMHRYRAPRLVPTIDDPDCMHITNAFAGFLRVNMHHPAAAEKANKSQLL